MKVRWRVVTVICIIVFVEEVLLREAVVESLIALDDTVHDRERVVQTRFERCCEVVRIVWILEIVRDVWFWSSRIPQYWSTVGLSLGACAHARSFPGKAIGIDLCDIANLCADVRRSGAAISSGSNGSVLLTLVCRSFNRHSYTHVTRCTTGRTIIRVAIVVTGTVKMAVAARDIDLFIDQCFEESHFEQC